MRGFCNKMKFWNRPLSEKEIEILHPYNNAPTTIWHKDGIILDITGKKENGRVYRNGQLADTKGQWEALVIIKN